MYYDYIYIHNYRYTYTIQEGAVHEMRIQNNRLSETAVYQHLV